MAIHIPEVSSYYPNFAAQPSRPQIVNPVMQTPNPSLLQKREVEYVNGSEGANNVLMGPNSSGLYLDKEMNVLWVVATDQNGNKSLVKGYQIGDEYVPPKPVTMEDLMAQMQSMNERLTKMEGAGVNGQSNFKPFGQSKSYGAGGAGNANNAVRNSNGPADAKQSTAQTGA